MYWDVFVVFFSVLLNLLFIKNKSLFCEHNLIHIIVLKYYGEETKIFSTSVFFFFLQETNLFI